jgi:threonyl-tRNA synthetase
MLVVGDREEEAGSISVRLRTGQQLNGMPFNTFKKAINTAIVNKAKVLEF